jgi:hypothetical protein
VIVGTFVRALPGWVMWLALGLLVTASAGWGWVQGAASVRDDWDAAIVKQSLTVARVQTAQAQVTERVVTQYVDRVRVVREAADAIIREVPVYVSAQCDPDGRLPAGWRVLHDAAARGSAAEPAAVAHAQPVDPQTAARAVAENYAGCRENIEQLTALQQWVREQAALGDAAGLP